MIDPHLHLVTSWSLIASLILQPFLTCAFFVPHQQQTTFSTLSKYSSNINNHNMKKHHHSNAFLYTSSSVYKHQEPSSSSSLLTLQSSNVNNNDIAFEDAFTDQIDPFGDSTVQLIFIGFGIVIILSIIAKLLLNQMDDAIEKVLIDFERVMKVKYPSRWVSIDKKLEGLGEVERSQKLFEIMEGLQQSEPDFMKRVNEDMSSSQ